MTELKYSTIIKLPSRLLWSLKWAFLLVYVLFLLPRHCLTETSDAYNNVGRSLTKEQERGGTVSETLDNEAQISEHESGWDEHELDVLPVVTTPPTIEPLLEELPRPIPPLEVQEVNGQVENLNPVVTEHHHDHMTSHDREIPELQVNSPSAGNEEVVPLIHETPNGSPSLDDSSTDSKDVPDSGGILMNSDATLSHDQGAELTHNEPEVDSDVAEAIKMVEESEQLPLPETSTKVPEEESGNDNLDNKVILVHDSEHEVPTQVKQCGELDQDCQQMTDTMAMMEDDVTDDEIEVEKEEEDDVPTFEEFKQKMMEKGAGQQQRVTEEQLLNSLHLSSQNQNKNFASLDCGAKVIETNPGAQNPSSILDENKDKYMINSCSSKIWFTVQLCELVSVRSLEIASFELFSSTPQSFVVYLAERYPTDNWFLLGTFLARNERSVQSFPIITDENVYANYIKVEMVSHYGEERYCPLSLFRVFGASMIEVFEESEQKNTPTQPSVILPSEGVGDDEIFWETLTETDEAKNGTLLHRAKDAVLHVISKINNFISPEDDSKDQDISLEPSPSTNESNEETALDNTTNTTTNDDTGVKSKGCDLSDEACVSEGNTESGLDGKIIERDKNLEEFDMRVEDTTDRADNTDQLKDDMVDTHHHGNSTQDSNSMEDAEQRLVHQLPNDEVSKDPTIEASPSKPSENDIFQSAEVNQLSATGEASDDKSMFKETEASAQEIPPTEKNTEQEKSIPAINPSPTHIITDTLPLNDTRTDKHSQDSQPINQDDNLPPPTQPDLPHSSNRLDNNYDDTEPETVNVVSLPKEHETINAPPLLDKDGENVQTSIQASLELNSEMDNAIHGDDHLPLGPETLVLQEENKAVSSHDEIALGPPILTTLEQQNNVPTQNTGTSKPEAALPSASNSEPYASVSESPTINQNAQNTVSVENDPPSDYSNDRPDLSGHATDGSLLNPAQNTTDSHIKTDEVINVSLVTDDAKSVLGDQEFETQSREFEGSNASVNEQSAHPHITSAPAVDGSSTANSGANVSDHSDAWNASNITENNDAENSSMNIVEPQLETQSLSVGTNISIKNNATLSASEGGSGTLLPPSHGVNGNGAPYLGSALPREKEKSVFLRLSNHIKELEVNMSIFSSYLDQMSNSLKRNKNRTEEAIRGLDKKISSLNETLLLLKNETSIQLHSLLQLNQELQQLTLAMADLSSGLDSFSHDIFSQQKLLAITNIVAILSLCVILCVWNSCSQRQVHRQLVELKTLIVNIKSEMTPTESSFNVFSSSSSPLATGKALHNSHVRSSSASELNDLTSVRGIGDLSLSHLGSLDVKGMSHCHGDELRGMNGLSSHSLSSLDDHRETSSEMWKVIDSRRKKRTKSKQKS